MERNTVTAKNARTYFLPAFSVLVLGLSCASGELNAASHEEAIDDDARVLESDGDFSQQEVDALKRENADLIAGRNAEWRSRYSDEDARKMLAGIGMRTWTYEELIAESTSKHALALSAEEEGLLRRHFEVLAAEEKIAFQGRVIFVGDVQMDADEVLAGLRGRVGTINKGFGCIATTAVSSDGCGGIAPAHMRNDGDGNVDTLDFFRPDTFRTTYYVVADAAPAFFFDSLVAVTGRIEELNPTGDCLVPESFFPIRQTDFNNLHPFVSAAAFVVPVTYGANPCNNDANIRACSFSPAFQSVLLVPPGPGGGGVTQSRLGFRGAGASNALKFNSNFFPADSAPFRGSIFHEFGHIMGRAHNVSSAATAKIPGTSVDSTVASVMDVSVTANRANALSGDDIQVIKTLYSDHPNRANDACPYVGAFRSYRAIPFDGCPPNSIPDSIQSSCCGPLCGTCGGSGCSGRPGGAAACCSGTIGTSGVPCTGLLSGPCFMP